MNIEKWVEVSERLKILKEEEAQLRRDICAELIAGTAMDKGKAKVTSIMNNYKVVAVQSLSYSIDKTILRAIWADLTVVEKECIKTEPRVWETKYKNLGEHSLLHEAITSRLGMPTLKAEYRER